MHNLKITEAIASGIKFIHNRQKTDGGFASETLLPGQARPAANQRTIFFPSLIFLCLAGLADPLANKSKRNLIRFLRKYKSPNGTFNYWMTPSSHPPNERYPDDWDDTACALAALAHSSALSGKDLFHAVRNLAAYENKPGGPYFTWLTPDPQAREIDLAVNANIAFFLSLYGACPKRLRSFMDKAVLAGNFSSPYYAHRWAVIYFLSRGYKGRHSAKLTDSIQRHLKKKLTRNSSQTAFAVCALLNLGFRGSIIGQCVKKILAAQNPDGGWDAFPFGIEKITKGRKHYSQCRELDTAICLEALDKYRQSINHLAHKPEKRFAVRVLKKIKKQIRNQPLYLKERLSQSLKRINLGADQQILMLPLWTNEIIEPNQSLSPQTLALLAEGNAWAWMAYRIYDDIMDRDATGKVLPVANWCLMRLCAIYSRLDREAPGLFRLLCSVLNKVEHANALEQVSGRITREGDKSFGAALPALAVITLKGKRPGSFLHRQISGFFTHYLSARQLNDDAHDWPQDLASGTPNPVANMVAKEAKRRKIDMDKNSAALQKIFWKRIIPPLTARIENHVNKAVASLKLIPPHPYKDRLLNLLVPLEDAALSARGQRRQAMDFLKHYRLATKTSRRDLVVRKRRPASDYA